LAEAGAIEAGGGGAGWGRAPPPVKNPDPLLRGDGRAHLPGVGGTEKRAEKHKRREATVTLVMPQQPLTRHDNMAPSRMKISMHALLHEGMRIGGFRETSINDLLSPSRNSIFTANTRSSFTAGSDMNIANVDPFARRSTLSELMAGM
jgi:hypothetical protein